MKGSIHQEDIVVLNSCAPNIRITKYIKENPSIKNRKTDPASRISVKTEMNSPPPTGYNCHLDMPSPNNSKTCILLKLIWNIHQDRSHIRP